MRIEPFQLERYFARYEFTARYLLSSSDCESVTVQELLNLEPGSSEKFHQLWLGYTESSGSPSVRAEISRIYQNISPDQILVHSGAQEAIFLFMNAVLSPSDHVIVHWPCYQSLFEVAKSIGCEITFWQAHEEDSWQLDLNELKKLIQSNTRALILNVPNNPTGYLMSKDKFLTLNEMLAEKNILLFSDEVYRESEYSPDLRLPAACDINPSAVSLGVVSKTYGLPGLRIGWAASRNQFVLQQMAALKDYTTICNSAPSEFLAELALKHRHQFVKRNLKIIQNNLSLLDTFFERHTDLFHWRRPCAGSIAFPRYLGSNVEYFCQQLVADKGVLLLPGTLFGDHENHFRIGFGRKNLPEALQVFESFLEK